jgi:hypothetical protein
MALSNPSAASGGGSSIEYVSSCIASNGTCTLTKHFCGSLLGYQSNTCLQINGTMFNSGTSSQLCNMLFPEGTVICSNTLSTAMIGYLIDP